MPKVKISEYSATANSNTDVASINIDEGCAPSGINNAIRAVMGHLKDFQQGTYGDPFNGPVNGTVGATTPATGAFTTLSSTGNSYFATSSGSVGIGTSSPLGKLQVKGANPQIFMEDSAGGTNGKFTAIGTSNGNMTFNRYLDNGTLFGQFMTLDSSGNLGIGTTSPSARLNVRASGVTAAALTIGGSDVNNDNVDFVFFPRQNYLSNPIARIRGVLTYGAGGSEAGDLTFSTCTGGTLSERARITSGGYFKASDDGVYAGAANTWHEFNQSANTLGLALVADNASFTSTACEISAARTTTNNSYYFLDCAHAGVAYKLRIADSGNVTNTNNSYGAISDIKLKENIVDATPKLEKLNQVRVVNFNFIGDQQKQLGVVAQELEQLFPGMIDESPDKDSEGNDLGTVTKSVKYSVFVPMLIKAMQELKAEVDSLKSQLNGA